MGLLLHVLSRQRSKAPLEAMGHQEPDVLSDAFKVSVARGLPLPCKVCAASAGVLEGIWAEGFAPAFGCRAFTNPSWTVE